MQEQFAFLRELVTFESICLLSRYMSWCGKGLEVEDRKINFVFQKPPQASFCRSFLTCFFAEVHREQYSWAMQAELSVSVPVC